MGRHTPFVIAAALVATAGAASAQVTMGAARVPGVTYRPAPPKPEPEATTSRSERTGPTSERTGESPRPEPQPHFRHHRSPDPQPTPGEDLFRATPDTYTPRPMRWPYTRYADFYNPYGTPALVADRVVEPVVVERTKVVVVEAPQAPREKEEEREAPPPPPVMVAVPKALYVIPRCYAGDKPPAAERLREGCDLRDMRVIR